MMMALAIDSSSGSPFCACALQRPQYAVGLNTLGRPPSKIGAPVSSSSSAFHRQLILTCPCEPSGFGSNHQKSPFDPSRGNVSHRARFPWGNGAGAGNSSGGLWLPAWGIGSSFPWGIGSGSGSILWGTGSENGSVPVLTVAGPGSCLVPHGP